MAPRKIHLTRSQQWELFTKKGKEFPQRHKTALVSGTQPTTPSLLKGPTGRCSHIRTDVLEAIATVSLREDLLETGLSCYLSKQPPWGHKLTPAPQATWALPGGWGELVSNLALPHPVTLPPALHLLCSLPCLCPEPVQGESITEQSELGSYKHGPDFVPSSPRDLILFVTRGRKHRPGGGGGVGPEAAMRSSLREVQLQLTVVDCDTITTAPGGGDPHPAVRRKVPTSVVIKDPPGKRADTGHKHRKSRK